MVPNPLSTRPTVITRTVTAVILVRSEMAFHHSANDDCMMAVSVRSGAETRLGKAEGSATSDLRRLQHVAEAALRLDDRLRAVRVELAPQVGDVGLHDAGVAVEVVLPDVVEDLRLRQDSVRVQHQVAQQLELG